MLLLLQRVTVIKVTKQFKVININVDPEIFNDKFYPLLFNKTRYEVHKGGAGSGKSVYAGEKILFRIISEKEHRILVLRKVAKTMRNSVFALFKDLIKDWGLEKLFKINKTDMTITCKANGNEIIFAGLDDVEKLKSIQRISSIWLEEASEIEQHDFLQLDFRLRGHLPNYKQILITFNPVSEFHWLKRFFFDNPKDNTLVMESTFLDNKFIDDEYKNVFERMKHEDPNYYNIYALGHWGSLGNTVIRNWEVKNISQNPDDYDLIVYGLDFGFNDPTALVKVGVKDDEIYIMEEFYKTEITNTELINTMKTKKIGKTEIYGDSANPDKILEIRRAGFNIRSCTKGEGSIDFGLDNLRRRKIYVHPSCIHFKEEVSNYVYQKDTDGSNKEKPIDAFNHLIDATRYALYNYFKNKDKSGGRFAARR